MNRPSQLTQLIWNFYRENQQELRRLRILGQCKVFRRWGVLQIQCSHPEVAEDLAAAIALIEEPVAQLRLAQKIKISFNRKNIAAFEVESGKRIA